MRQMPPRPESSPLRATARSKCARGGKLARSAQIKRVGKAGTWRTNKADKRKRSSALKEEAARTGHGPFVAQYLNKEGHVNVDDVARSFGISKGQLAETIGVRPETLQRFSRTFAPRTQTRLREMLEIIGRIIDWAGGKYQAMGWYRGEPIPSFGGRTAESMVKDGKASAVRDHLDHIALGGFA